MMGNSAAAWAALAAGVNVICGYPGTPSSELIETAAALVKDAVCAERLAADRAPHVEWSVNEKVALEVAFGASVSGARALVTMKQVGLNVAVDPLMTIAYLGVKGGLVLYVADDPGPISSQTEQDTRQLAQFAKVPVLDAASPEELYDMMSMAFGLSERHETPVIVRATTRVCHGSAPIPVPDAFVPHVVKGFERDPRWVIFPSLALKAHEALPERLAALVADPELAALNHVVPADGAPSRLGIVAGGISWAYLLDALAQRGLTGRFDLMKIGAPYPFADQLAADFLSSHDRVLVFEELEATIERELLRVAGSRQLQVPVFGRLTGSTAYAGEGSIERIAGELRPFIDEKGATAASASVPPSLASTPHAPTAAASSSAPASPAPALASPATTSASAGPASASPAPASALVDATSASPASVSGQKDLLLPRPPVLCAGCPHRASFYAVKKALRGRKATYSGDIGCYTLGNALPLDMVDSCVCMGAGFTVPQGMHWAEPDVPHLGFVGDSTFFASGLTGVANAVYNRTPVTFIVLDNSITAMTGSQPHPGTGIRMSHDSGEQDAACAISIPRVLDALGIEQVSVVDPLDLSEAIDAVKTAVDAPRASAVVFKSPCINLIGQKPAPAVLSDACTGCYVCVDSVGCPALVMDEGAGAVRIDPRLCNGCNLCVQVCPFSALENTHRKGDVSLPEGASEREGASARAHALGPQNASGREIASGPEHASAHGNTPSATAPEGALASAASSAALPRRLGCPTATAPENVLAPEDASAATTPEGPPVRDGAPPASTLNDAPATTVRDNSPLPEDTHG